MLLAKSNRVGDGQGYPAAACNAANSNLSFVYTSEVAEDVDEPTATQFAAWTDKQGINLGEMRAWLAGNCTATRATMAHMERMRKEAGMPTAPNHAQPRRNQDNANRRIGRRLPSSRAGTRCRPGTECAQHASMTSNEGRSRQMACCPAPQWDLTRPGNHAMPTCPYLWPRAPV